MDFLVTLINRGVEHDNVAYAANATGNGAPAGPKYSATCYCGRRLAGLETGPIPDRGPAVSAGLWILVSFSTTFLAARIWLKMYRLKGLWWDDYILVLAWAMHTISCILAQVAISFFGLGHYPCDIPNPLVNIPRINMIGDHFGAMLSMFAVAASKTSWAVTLLRLFHRGNNPSSPGDQAHHHQYRVWIVWFVIVTICLVKGAQGILVWIPKCGSPAALGKPDMCVMIGPLNGFATFAGGMSGTYDILLAVVPWKTIWGTNLRKREKLALATTMSIGAVSAVSAFILAEKMKKITSENFTYDSGEIIVWSTAETATTIMAACIPVHRAFCRQLQKKLLAQYRTFNGKQRSAPPTGNNGSGGSTTLTGGSTTLTSGTFRSVIEKISQHRRNGSDGVKETGCLSLSSGGGGCHAPSDDNASDRAILPVHDIESRLQTGSDGTPSRNSGRILMTQEIKIEYHRHDEILDGTGVLDERERQALYGHELKEMGRQRIANAV
ncbi:hypothetical protein B0T20DRAFT_364555 [Sordaria brevicollis]|uniref:Rhodopsin domain-containing protein n=1 Tax=Sordaria brevicollis TaxID=83679 RepID=A0AAE0NVW5_SORBR|nr:hypothetical protein B0T20DRAFT_364555 [Sordaria brevicollis]